MTKLRDHAELVYRLVDATLALAALESVAPLEHRVREAQRAIHEQLRKLKVFGAIRRGEK